MPDHKPGQGIPIRSGRSLRRQCNRRRSGGSLEKRRLESAPCRAPGALHGRNNGGGASEAGTAARVLKQERDQQRTRGVRYLLGSYRIATAPEPNSSRLTSLKSTRFDSPANNVGPWPASLGCTTNSYSSINCSSANVSGSFTPPTNSPLPGSRLSC